MGLFRRKHNNSLPNYPDFKTLQCTRCRDLDKHEHEPGECKRLAPAWGGSAVGIMSCSCNCMEPRNG